ncbi:MAG: hypothetical protein J6Y94_02580 [Bacteriovoracaceae bacterium]|nr:hypothetical protein [Bacteriovoracaceae bacterium]
MDTRKILLRWVALKCSVLLFAFLGAEAMANECASFLQERFQISPKAKWEKLYHLYPLVHAKTSLPLGKIVLGPKSPQYLKRYAAQQAVAPDFVSFLAGKKNQAGIILAGNELIIQRKKKAVQDDQFLIQIPYGLIYVKLKKPWPSFAPEDQQALQSVVGGYLSTALQQRYARYDIWHDVTFVAVVGAVLSIIHHQGGLDLDLPTVRIAAAIAGVSALRGLIPWQRSVRHTNFAMANIFEELALGHFAKLIEDWIVFVPHRKQLKKLERYLVKAQLKVQGLDEEPAAPEEIGKESSPASAVSSPEEASAQMAAPTNPSDDSSASTANTAPNSAANPPADET